MSLISSLGISRSALQAERLRMDVVANNLANMNTTRTDEGGPYQRQTVVFRAADGGTPEPVRPTVRCRAWVIGRIDGDDPRGCDR